VSAGLFLTVLERPDDIKNLKIPSIMAQTCREWSAFTNTTIPNQIDSGLWFGNSLDELASRYLWWMGLDVSLRGKEA
jgi:hypothetical protein